MINKVYNLYQSISDNKNNINLYQTILDNENDINLYQTISDNENNLYQTISDDANTILNDDNSLTYNICEYLSFLTNIITMCILLSFVIFIFIYILTIIIALSYWTYNNQSQLCPNSNLYEYGTISIIYIIIILQLKCVNKLYVESIYNDMIITIYKTYHMLIELILITMILLWGIYEFYYVGCINNLYDTILYNYTHIFFIFSIMYFIIYIITSVSKFPYMYTTPY